MSKKRTYMSKQQAAVVIFEMYVQNLDEPITDADMAHRTGLTPSQVAYGKRWLREVVAADEHFMYVAGRHGCYLTQCPPEARQYVAARAKVARTQTSLVLAGTIKTLVETDPAAKIVMRGYERLIEDLEFLASMADSDVMA